MDNKSNERHKELSLMFLKMGKALVDEGIKDKDYVVANMGNNMIFMSGLIFDKDDTRLFGEMCNMLSSRRLVKGITNGTIDVDRLNEIKRGSINDPFSQINKKIDNDKKTDENDDDDDNNF